MSKKRTTAIKVDIEFWSMTEHPMIRGDLVVDGIPYRLVSASGSGPGDSEAGAVARYRSIADRLGVPFVASPGARALEKDDCAGDREFSNLRRIERRRLRKVLG